MPEEATQQSYQAPHQNYVIPNDKADLLDKIQPERIVELIRNRLMGKVENNRGEWTRNPSLAKNAISETGAWDLSNLMLSVSNSNVSISKLDDKEIRRRAYSIMESAIKMMLSNWKEYKITNTAQIRYIADIIFSIAFITMKQCDSEGIRKMIMGTRQETHQVAEYAEQNKKSVFRIRRK